MQVPYAEVDVERTDSGDEPGQDPCFPVGEFGPGAYENHVVQASSLFQERDDALEGALLLSS